MSVVGLGWPLSRSMSGFSDTAVVVGQGGPENWPGASVARAAVHRSLVNMLTIGTEPGRRGGISPAGLTHSVGVAFLEMAIMARGAKKTAAVVAAGGMPRFVDVKLTAEDKMGFVGWKCTPQEIVTFLQDLCDDGYRVGCSWSSESQSYTVSLTCRNEGSPNAGLCMTSFARDLHTAVALAVYKHTVVTEERWVPEAVGDLGDFG